MFCKHVSGLDYVKLSNNNLNTALFESNSLNIPDTNSLRSISYNKNDSLVIVGVKDKEPLEFINNNGKPDGYNVDVCKKVMQIMGISHYKIILTSQKECNFMFYSGKADLLISGLSFSSFSFDKCSFPYLYLHNSVIIPDASKIVSVKDIINKRLLMNNNIDYLKNNLKLTKASDIYVYKSYIEGLDSLRTGRYAAMMGFDILLRNILNKQSDRDNYRILKLNIGNYPFSFISSRKDSSLIIHIDKALYELNLDGTINKMKEKWFGNTEEKMLNIFLFKILRLSLFILFIVILIMYIIRFFIKKARKDRVKESKYLLDTINDLSGFIYLIRKGEDKLFFCNENVKSLISKNLSVEECINSLEKPERAREVNKQIFIDKKLYVVEEKATLNNNTVINNLTYKKYVTNGVDEFILVVRTDVTDLVNAREKAKKDNIRQQEFLKNISHEIRTPLNAIVGFSELLFELDSELGRKEYLEIISTNCKVLNIIVNDILLLAKLESGTFKLLPVRMEMNGLILNIIEKEKYLLTNNKDIKIIFDKYYDYFNLLIDQSFMYSLLHNFLSNAIKNTNKGEIRLGCFMLHKDLVFYVKDTGKGIAREQWINIFSKFSKINSFLSGTGMGLSICKEYTKYLKSAIGLCSIEDKGSLFWFSINISNMSLDYKKLRDFDNKNSIIGLLNMRKNGFWYESDGKGHIELHDEKNKDCGDLIKVKYYNKFEKEII